MRKLREEAKRSSSRSGSTFAIMVSFLDIIASWAKTDSVMTLASAAIKNVRIMKFLPADFSKITNTLLQGSVNLKRRGFHNL